LALKTVGGLDRGPGSSIEGQKTREIVNRHPKASEKKN